MDFVEQFSNSKYFQLHPGKVAGKEVKTTSRAFPFTIEGGREDVENMFSFLYRESNEDLDLIIAIAEAESEILQLLNTKLEGVSNLRILVACEETQQVTTQLRKRGFEAFSCDIIPCSGSHPEWHIQDDVLNHLNDGWDLMIAFPPCTYLTNAGNRWKKDAKRQKEMKKALAFVEKLMNAPIPYIAIENPIGAISTAIRKPDQIVQPWQFGDKAQKSTCLWLKNLPKLKPTMIVDKGEFKVWYDEKAKRIKRQPLWYYEASFLSKEERQKLRSATFPGIAKAMATQWTKHISNELHKRTRKYA